MNLTDREIFSCPSCGSLEPARLGTDTAGTSGCSDCLTFQRCCLCERWTGEEYGAFVHPVVGLRGERLGICEPCHEKADEAVA